MKVFLFDMVHLKNESLLLSKMLDKCCKVNIFIEKAKKSKSKVVTLTKVNMIVGVRNTHIYTFLVTERKII